MSDLQGKKPIRMCSCGADSEDLLTYFCDGHCIACKRCGDKATSRFPGDNKFAPLRRWNIKHQAMPWASPSPETPVSLRLWFMTANEKSAALRFLETTEDAQEYDVAKPMMRRLAKLGLVEDEGNGRYTTTHMLLQMRDELSAVLEAQ